jgi:hypothetical protein
MGNALLDPFGVCEKYLLQSLTKNRTMTYHVKNCGTFWRCNFECVHLFPQTFQGMTILLGLSQQELTGIFEGT